MLSLISVQYSSVITISAVILAPLLGHVASKYLMAWQHTIFGIFFAQIVGQVTLVNLCIQIMLSIFSSQLFRNHRLIATPCPPPPPPPSWNKSTKQDKLYLLTVPYIKKTSIISTDNDPASPLTVDCHVTKMCL